MWGKMPGWAKFLAIFMSAVMLTLGVSNHDLLFSLITAPNSEIVEPVAADTVEVDFLIYSKDGNEPLERAEVQFIFNGAPEPRLTNSDGYVRVEIPKRDDIDVVIKKEGFKDLNRTINLLADPNRTITYFLDTDELFSSYNLRGQKLPEGTRLRMSGFTKAVFEEIDGESSDSSVDDPFVTLKIVEESNKEVEYEFTQVEDSQPTQILEKVEKDRSLVTGEMRFLAKDENKSYEYNRSLSEASIFEDHSILNENKSGKWFGSLVGRSPTSEQRTQLEKPWTYYDSISYEYPAQRLKVGQSWSFDDFATGIGLTTTESDVVATLSEITDYEGEEAALITIEGSARAIDSNLDEPSRGRFPEDRESATSQIMDFFYESLLKDISLDYAVPALTKQIAEDLFYDEFTLGDQLKTNSPEAYERIINMYQEISSEERFGSYTLPTIKAIVENKFDEKEIPKLMSEAVSSSWLNEDAEVSDDAFGDRKVIYNLSVEGRIYRALNYPIDLLVDIEVSGNIQEDGSKYDVVGTYINKFSIL